MFQIWDVIGSLVIDAHCHLGKMHAIEANADGLAALADEMGFDRVMCIHLGALFYDMEEGNRETAEAVRRHPDRIMGYCAIPTSRFGEAGLNEISRCAEFYGLRGVKIYSQPHALGSPHVMFPADDPWMHRVLHHAAELGLPVLAHISPQESESLARAVPECNLLMAHMGCTPIARGDWHRAIMAAERYPNLYLETCTSTVDMGAIESAVAALGAERIVFGTDAPLLNPHVQLARIKYADIPEQAKTAILGNNMARLLNL